MRRSGAPLAGQPPSCGGRSRGSPSRRRPSGAQRRFPCLPAGPPASGERGRPSAIQTTFLRGDRALRQRHGNRGQEGSSHPSGASLREVDGPDRRLPAIGSSRQHSRDLRRQRPLSSSSRLRCTNTGRPSRPGPTAASEPVSERTTSPWSQQATPRDPGAREACKTVTARPDGASSTVRLIDGRAAGHQGPDRAPRPPPRTAAAADRQRTGQEDGRWCSAGPRQGRDPMRYAPGAPGDGHPTAPGPPGGEAGLVDLEASSCSCEDEALHRDGSATHHEASPASDTGRVRPEPGRPPVRAVSSTSACHPPKARSAVPVASSCPRGTSSPARCGSPAAAAAEACAREVTRHRQPRKRQATGGKIEGPDTLRLRALSWGQPQRRLGRRVSPKTRQGASEARQAPGSGWPVDPQRAVVDHKRLQPQGHRA